MHLMERKDDSQDLGSDLTESLIINSIIGFLFVESVQFFFQYLGRTIINWMEECNGKKIRVGIFMQEQQVYKIVLDKYILLSIASIFEQFSLNFVILAITVPCSALISAYGSLDDRYEKEGPIQCVALLITSFATLFKTELILTSKRGRLRTSYTSIAIVVCIWVVSLSYIGIRELKCLIVEENEKFLFLKTYIIVEHNFFFLRYVCLFVWSGLFIKPVFTSRKKQFWFTIFSIIWLTTIFLAISCFKG